MAKFFIPKLTDYQSSSLFFKDLFLLNKRNKAKFSQRYLAKALDWPASYAADMVKGRKRLTVPRALEFAKLAKLNVLDTEKIVYLALADSASEPVRDHFAEVLKRRNSKDSAAYIKTTEIEQKLFSDIEIGAVFEVLKWARRPLEAHDIKKLLFTFTELTVEKINASIKILIEHGMISIHEAELKILKKELVMDQFNDGTDGGIKIHTQYAKNFTRYTEKPKFPGLFTSGFVEIPKGQFNDVAKKLLEIRNWLLQYSFDNNSLKKETLESSYIYQFDIKLVLMIDKMVAQKLSATV